MIVNGYRVSFKSKIKRAVIGKKRYEENNHRKYVTNVKDFIDQYDYNNPSLPTRIEVETINKCNGECSFCPANKHSDTRPTQRMSDELFKKIMDNLGRLDYAGRLGLHSNNEPLLDVRIVDFAKIAKESCPKAKLYIYTNGILMTEAKYVDLMKYLDYIVIDNYNDDLKLNENLIPIYEYSQKDNSLNERTEIHMRKQNEILSTRGGMSPNNKGRIIQNYPCYMPFVQLVIRPDGKVSQCCCDVYGTKTMGNLQESNIEDIWFSQKYINLRKIISQGRDKIDICKFCDMEMNAT